MSLTPNIWRLNYKLGNNIGLETTEKKPEFKSFEKIVYQTLEKQFNSVSNNRQLINELVVTTAKFDRGMLEILAKFWKPFIEIVGVNTLLKFMVWSGERGGQAALIRLGSGQVFDLRNQAVIQALNDWGLNSSRRYDLTTQNQIINLIVTGREMQLTSFEISEYILERFEELGRNRAYTIAFNEMSQAMNLVEFETFLRNQVKRVRWVTALDERTCPICEPLHNQDTGIGNDFHSHNDKITFNSHRPPAHVNCRCYLEEVIDGITIRDEKAIWTGK
jgi:SPP1 gp7 family putative phage head morphogenesis protein